MRPSEEKTGGWLELEGRVCAVTGAAGAIGSEIARALIAAGALVALLDLDEGRAVETATQIGGKEGRAIGIGCDVTSQDSVIAASLKVERDLGACRALINNAAALHPAALLDIALEEWNRILAINLTGYFLPAQVFGRQMVASGEGGSMIHIGSVSGSFPQPYSGAYSVSKAGVAMLSQVLTVELGEHGIRSNLVSPGMVHTPMSDSIYKDPDVRRKREEIVPSGRISVPVDLADAVLFLASDRSSYITGQNILVDGGLSQALLKMIPRPGFDKAAATKAGG